MKKTVKKLVLAKETLTHLEQNIVEVAGGATGYAGCPGWTGVRTCATCGATCTSNLC